MASKRTRDPEPEPLIPFPPPDFTGREALVRSLIGTISREPLVAVTGARGIGKSALLAAAAQRMKAAGEARRILWLEPPPGATLDGLLLQLTGADPELGESGTALFRRAAADLNRRPAVVFVDPADRIEDPRATERWRLLSRFAQGTTFVLGLRAPLPADGADGEEPARLRVPPLSDADAFELFRRGRARAGGAPPEARPEAVDRLRRATGGHPGLVRYLARREERGAIAFDLFAVIDPDGTLSPAARDLLHRLLLAGVPVPADALDAHLAEEGPGARPAFDRLAGQGLVDAPRPGWLAPTLALAVAGDDPECEAADRLLARVVAEPARVAEGLTLESCLGVEPPELSRPAPEHDDAWLRRVDLLAARADRLPGQRLAREFETVVKWCFAGRRTVRLAGVFARIEPHLPAFIAASPVGIALLGIGLALERNHPETERLARAVASDASGAGKARGKRPPLVTITRALSAGRRGETDAAVLLLEEAFDAATPPAAVLAAVLQAEMLRSSGRMAEADAALAAAGDVANRSALPSLEREVALRRSYLLFWAGEYRAVLAVLDRADRTLGRPSPAFLARSGAMRASCLIEVGAFEAGVKAANEAMARFRELGMMKEYYHLLGMRAKALISLDRADTALEEYERGRRFAAETGELNEEIALAITIALIKYDRDEYAAAMQLLEEAIGLCRRAGDALSLAFAHVNLACVDFALGMFDDARELAGVALREYDEIRRRDNRVSFDALRTDYLLGEIDYCTGDPAAAERRFTDLLPKFRGIEDLLHETLCHAYLGLCRVHAGDPAGALRAFDRSVTLSVRKGVHPHQFANQIVRLMLLVRHGDRKAAERAAALYLETADRFFLAGRETHGRIARRLLAALENPDPGLVAGLHADFSRLGWKRLAVTVDRFLVHLFPGATGAGEAPPVPAAASAPAPVTGDTPAVWRSADAGSGFRPVGADELKRLRAASEAPDLFLDFREGIYRTRHAGPIQPGRKRTLLKLLKYFAARPRRLLGVRELYEAVWEAEFEPVNASTVHVTVRRLRALIEPDPAHPRHLATREGPDGEPGYELAGTGEWVVVL